ncbi:MAG: Crp/Fnr family transcriptional regulator [Candidatus Dormibacteria bacterium]
MAGPATRIHRGNRVLDGLPADVRERVMTHVLPMSLKVKKVLFEPGEVITHVYLPLNGVISLVAPLRSGEVVEVATVGNEGIVGVPLQSRGSLSVRAISQVSGTVLRMDVEAFLEEFSADGDLRGRVLSYTAALFGQISQSAACNRLHTTEERLSRWLLMSHDRAGRDEFGITQEFLGQMLGTRRSSVTISAGILQSAGLISYRRGRLTVRDREGLQAVACECYGVIRALFEPVAQRCA